MSDSFVRLHALVRKLARDVSVAHHGTIMPAGHIEQELDEIHALHAREGDTMQHVHQRLDNQLWRLNIQAERIDALEKAMKASEPEHPGDDAAPKEDPPEPKKDDPPAAEAKADGDDEDEEERHKKALIEEAQHHADEAKHDGDVDKA